MDANIFYSHVSNWIKSYQNTEALEWLRRFVNNSYQSERIKQRLHKEIDWQIAGIASKPRFTVRNNDLYLVDREGMPAVYTDHIDALLKAAELREYGYEVALMQDGHYYRVRLTHTTAPIAPVTMH